jgi:hypothetical protein
VSRVIAHMGYLECYVDSSIVVVVFCDMPDVACQRDSDKLFE